MQQQDKTCVCVLLERGVGWGGGQRKTIFRAAGLRMEVNFLGIQDMGVLCFLFVPGTATKKSSRACVQSTSSLVQCLIATRCENDWLLKPVDLMASPCLHVPACKKWLNV